MTHTNKNIILLVYKSFYQICRTFDKKPVLKALMVNPVIESLSKRRSRSTSLAALFGIPAEQETTPNEESNNLQKDVQQLFSPIFPTSRQIHYIPYVSFVDVLRNQYKQNKSVGPQEANKLVDLSFAAMKQLSNTLTNCEKKLKEYSREISEEYKEYLIQKNKERGSWAKLLKITDPPKKGMFLISHPGLMESTFHNTIIYIHEIDDSHLGGHVEGVILNKKGTKYNFGGPVPPRGGQFTVFMDKETKEAIETDKPIVELDENLYSTTADKNVIQTLQQKDCKNWKIFESISAWTKGQLEQELATGTWIPCELSHDFIFESKHKRDEEFERAMLLLGGEYADWLGLGSMEIDVSKSPRVFVVNAPY